MKSKIFRSFAYAIMMAVGINTFASAQDTTSNKQKQMEVKMKQMEAKLKAMQVKLDSIQSNEHIISDNGTLIIHKTAPKAYRTPPPLIFKKAPLAAMAPIAPKGAMDMDAFGPNGSFTKAFEGFHKTTNFSITDDKLQEKIKSGDIKLKTKNYSKSYSISSGDKLQIENTFGSVTVNTWNKNEFKVDVEIKSMANDDDEAQKMIDGVTINDSKDGSVVSFATNIQNKSNSWGMHTNNGNSTFQIHKTEVNYTVYIPSKNALTITNRYGVVTLPDFKGKLVLNTSYGSLISKELNNTDNEINTRYTEVNIGTINGGNVKCVYGSMIKIGTANNLNLETRSVSTDIDKLKSSGNITTRYGNGLKINNIDKNVKSLNINSEYAPVAIDVKSGNNFDFDVTVRNNSSGFKYTDDAVKVTNTSPDDDRHRSLTKNYKGYVGKSNNDTKVTITTSYQPVVFL